MLTRRSLLYRALGAFAGASLVAVSRWLPMAGRRALDPYETPWPNAKSVTDLGDGWARVVEEIVVEPGKSYIVTYNTLYQKPGRLGLRMNGERMEIIASAAPYGDPVWTVITEMGVFEPRV